MFHREFITTNIRLPKEYLKGLKQKALQREKSVSFLLRELVREYLGEDVREKQQRAAYSIWDFPRLARKTGDSRLASKIDPIIYGT